MKNKTKKLRTGNGDTGVHSVHFLLKSEKDHSTNNNLFLTSPFSGKKLTVNFLDFLPTTSSSLTLE